MRVINKAINARCEAASQTHKEIQTPVVLALLVLAKALSVLEGSACGVCVCRIHFPGEAAGWGFGIFQQVPNFSMSFGGICASPSKQSWKRPTGAGGPAALRSCQGWVIEGWSSLSIFPGQLLCQLGALGKKNGMMFLQQSQHPARSAWLQSVRGAVLRPGAGWKCL